MKHIVLHLHKTGGSSFIRWLAQKHGWIFDSTQNGNVSLADYAAHDATYLHSFPYDMCVFEFGLPKLPVDGCSSYCLFRDPVDRHWSNYCYDSMIYGEITLQEYVEQMPIYCQANYMCKFFSGYVHVLPETVKIDMEAVLKEVIKIDHIYLLEDIAAEMPVVGHVNSRQMTDKEREFLTARNSSDIDLYNKVKSYVKTLKNIKGL